jgi:hypothetical protein
MEQEQDPCAPTIYRFCEQMVRAKPIDKGRKQVADVGHARQICAVVPASTGLMDREKGKYVQYHQHTQSTLAEHKT